MRQWRCAPLAPGATARAAAAALLGSSKDEKQREIIRVELQQFAQDALRTELQRFGQDLVRSMERCVSEQISAKVDRLEGRQESSSSLPARGSSAMSFRDYGNASTLRSYVSTSRNSDLRAVSLSEEQECRPSSSTSQAKLLSSPWLYRPRRSYSAGARSEPGTASRDLDQRFSLHSSSNFGPRASKENRTSAVKYQRLGTSQSQDLSQAMQKMSSLPSIGAQDMSWHVGSIGRDDRRVSSKDNTDKPAQQSSFKQAVLKKSKSTDFGRMRRGYSMSKMKSIGSTAPDHTDEEDEDEWTLDNVLEGAITGAKSLLDIPQDVPPSQNEMAKRRASIEFLQQNSLNQRTATTEGGASRISASGGADQVALIGPGGVSSKPSGGASRKVYSQQANFNALKLAQELVKSAVPAFISDPLSALATASRNAGHASPRSDLARTVQRVSVQSDDYLISSHSNSEDAKSEAEDGVGPLVGRYASIISTPDDVLMYEAKSASTGTEMTEVSSVASAIERKEDKKDSIFGDGGGLNFLDRGMVAQTSDCPSSVMHTTSDALGPVEHRQSQSIWEVKRGSMRKTTRRLSDGMYFSPIALTEEEGATSMKNFVLSDTFAFAISCSIICSAISIGAQTDWMARNWAEDSPLVFKLLDHFFCLIFTVEMVLRIYVHRCRFFREVWNIFDFIVVSLQLSEVMVFVVGSIILRVKITSNSDFKGSLPLLRILRLVRILRIARVLHIFSELRTLIVSIAVCFRSVCWCGVMLLLMVYIISVYLTQVVTDHKVKFRHEMELEEEEELQKFYGALTTSMLTLYETISEGIHWHDVMDPLVEYCNPWLALVFFFYISFTIFAVLNVVTGVFVESAIQTINDDKKAVLMYQMRELFQSADTDGSGTIDMEEFWSQLESPKMQAYLKAVDLHPEEARELFNLLDMDESDEIPIEDFVHGCLRLHGQAKAIDLATFMHEYRKWCRTWLGHAFAVESSLKEICEVLGRTGVTSAVYEEFNLYN